MENNNDALDFNTWANSILNSGENKSKDFSISDLTKDAMKLPVSYYGAYNTSDYKKYLGSSAVEEVGINPGWSNREFEVKFDEAQPYTEAVANTISKFADITKNATVNYFKSYYTGADDLIAYNQKKAQEDSNKGFSDPTFTSSTNSGLGSIFSTDFYENLFPSLGYVVGTMGSAVAENIAIDLLTGGAGAGAELLNSGRKVKNTINYLLNIDKIKGALKAEQALTGMQKFKAGAQMYNLINGVRSEAGMEGGNNAFETSEKMKKDYKDKYGYEPFGEDLLQIEEYAKSAGKATYNINLPILMASNLVQFADLLIPEVVLASEALEDSWKGYNLVNKGTTLAPQLELEQQTFSQLWNAAKGIEKVKAVAQYTSEIPAFKYLTSAGAEGMEESLQKIASTSSQDYYTNKLKGTEGIWDSTKHGLGEALSDEGVQEFLGGFMIGSLSHARHGVTSLANKTQDLFTKKEDRPVRLSQKDIEFNKMKEKVAYLNDTSIDKVLKSDGIKDAFVNGQLSREIKAFSKTGDIFNLKNAQDHALLNYLWAGYKTGKLDYRLNELEKIANLDYSKEELASMLGVSVNELNDKRGSQAVRNIIDKVKENKVNFQAVEDYFEKNSNVGELRQQYNDDSNEFTSLVNDYVIQHKAKDFNDVLDKLNEREVTDLLVRQMKLEESKANLIAYNEGVKVAAFAYASLQTDKARQTGIFNILANRSKLDYTSARELMNVRVAEEKAKQLKEAIKTAKAINDPEVKNYEKQLELVENIIEEHGKDHFMSPNKMAKLLQDFAHESLPAAERVTIKKDAILMNDLRPLVDAVKLEKKNRRNVELYDYLMNIKNFNNHNRKISKDIMNFRKKTIDWFAQMQEEKTTPATETTTTATPAAPETETKTPENAKFKKGDKVSYEQVVYSILDTVDVGNGKFAYSLVDSAGEPLLDEKDLKMYVEESELEPFLVPAPPPAPKAGSAPILTGEEKKKDDAINLFVANNPSYKKEEIEFVTEKDANGKTTNKVISKNPMNKGEDLSSKPEFKNLIKELDDTQEQRDEEKRKEEELKAKIKEFNSEKVRYINGKKTFTKEEKRKLIEDVKDFMEANGLDPRKVTGTLKELVQSIMAITPIVEVDDQEDNDYVQGFFPEGRKATNPFKTSVQEEETVTLPNGERQGTGKILDEHLEGTYNHFVQSSLADPNFIDGFYSVEEGGDAQYYLTMVMDSEEYDYERSKEFQEQMKKGTAKFGVILIVTDAEGNPVRFNDDYSISSSPSEGRIIRYPFTFVGNTKTGDLYVPSFNIAAAVEILVKNGYTQEDAQFEINNKLQILRHLREYLLQNPEEKLPIDFASVSAGVILGNQVKNNSNEFLKDEDFELEIVKDENSKGGEIVPFRNTEAVNGSLAAVITTGGTETVVTVHPNEITNDIRNEINAILAHDFTLPDGTIDKSINKVKKYLDALIYTKQGSRQFVIKGNKIVYKEGETELESFPEKPFLLNVYSKNINEKSEKPKFKKDGDQLVLDTNNTGTVFTSWDYNAFILNNSFIRGVKSEGKVRRVNRYINFDVPTSTLKQTGFIDLSEEEPNPTQTTTSDIEAKKAEIEKERKERLREAFGENLETIESILESLSLTKEEQEEEILKIPGFTKGIINNRALNAIHKYEDINKDADKKLMDLIPPLQIGKVKNTSYEVKTDGVYINGKKVHDPSAGKMSALELIMWDIKKRLSASSFEKNTVRRFYDMRHERVIDGVPVFTASIFENLYGIVRNLNMVFPENKELEELLLNAFIKTTNSWAIRRDRFDDIFNILEKFGMKNDTSELNQAVRLKMNAELEALEKGSTSKETTKLNNEVFEKDPDAQADIKENPTEIQSESQNALDSLFNATDEDEDGLNRRKEIINEVATQLMKDSEYEFLIKTVGKDNIINLFNIANSDAWAKWTTAGVTLWKNPKRGTGYHESWHHFSQLYLTKKQKKALYNEVRNKETKLKDATDLQVEEYLADDFMNYMLSGGKKSELLDKYPVKKNIFQKIWNLLKALFSGTRPVDLNKLYTDLRLGNLNNYKSSIDNAMFGKLERAIYDETGTKEIMPSEKVSTYVKTADAYIGQILTERNSKYKGMRLLDLYSLSTLLENNDKLSLIYSILRNKFKEESNEEVNNGLSKKVKKDFAKLIEKGTWEKFIQEHLRANKIGISKESDIETEEIVGEESQEFSEKIHDKASNSEDLFKNAPQEIKKLLSFIQKRKAKIVNGRILSEQVYDSFGLPILCEQRNLFDRLCVELNGLDSVNEMIEKLRKPETLIRVPEALEILEFLPIDPGEDLSKINLRSTFLQAFSNPYIQAVKGVVSKNGDFSLQEVTRLGEDELKRTFLDNFNGMRKNTNFVKEGIVATDENGINYITDKINDLQFNFALKTDVTRFLSLLGVKFDSNVFVDNTLFNEFKRSVTTADLTRLFNNIKHRAAWNIPSLTNNPITELVKGTEIEDPEKEGEYVKFPSNFTVIKNILAFANKYNFSSPNASYINASGEVEYAFQKHNGFTQRISVINRVNSAEELRNTPGFENYNFETNPHMRGSEWANLLFDFSKPGGPKRIDKRTGENVKLVIRNYNGFESSKSNNSFKKVTSDLTAKEKFMFDMFSFLSSGVVDIIRTESATSFYSIAPTTYNPNSQNFSPLMISMDEVSMNDNIFLQPSFTDTVKKYLEAELYKIKNGEDIYGKVLSKEKKNEKELSEFEKVVNFTLFADILSDELKNKLKKEIKTNDNLTEVIANNEEAIRTDVSNYFNNYKEDMESLFEQFAVSQKDLPVSMVTAERKKLNNEKISRRKELRQEYRGNKEALEIQLKALDKEYQEKNKQIFDNLKSTMAATFVANHFIQSVEFLKFFESDLGYYKDYFKRSKGMNSTGAPAFDDPSLNAFLANSPSMASALDVSYSANDFNVAKTFALKDDERPSISNDSKFKNKKIGTKKVTQMVHDTLLSIHLAEKALNPKAKFAFTNAEIEEVERQLERYEKKANGADGQGYCTLDFYRFLKNKFGNWSKEEEALYQSEVLKFKLHEGVFKTEEEKNKVNKQIRSLQKTAKGVTFPVIKVNYRGVANNKAFTPVMDKFSLAPLLIDSIKGTSLESMNKQMLKDKVGYGKFKSGTKLWAPTLNELFQNGQFSFKNDSIVDHYPNFIKEQIKSDPNTKNKVTISTQSRALIFADLYQNGVPNDYNGNASKWNKLTPKEKAKASWVEATRQRYLQNINDIIEYHKEKLYEEIGVTKDGNKFIINDQEKLIKAIQKEVLRKGLNKNVEEYIVYDPITKKSTLPLDYAQNRTGISDIILGIVDKEVRRLKINGSQLIQIAGTGFQKVGKETNFTKPTDKQLETYGTNGLNFYYLKKDAKGKWYTEPMGIKVSLSGDFKNLLNLIHPDGKVIGTRERLNDIIAADENRPASYQKWIDDHKKQLTVVGCRIPVGDTNFHDVMLIKEFLPESQGDVIVLPHESTVKSGTDYDIDKMTFYRPVINPDGTLAKNYNKKDEEAAEKELTELENRRKEIRSRIKAAEESVIDTFGNVSDLSDKKKLTYENIKKYNAQLNALYNEDSALRKDRKNKTLDKDIRLGELFYEIEILENRRNIALSSMSELSTLQNEYFESNKELREISNRIKTINNNLNSINSYTNDMIDIYSEILSNPTVFKKLITPSANDDYNNSANRIGDKMDRKNKEYKNTRVVEYMSSLDKFRELIGTKRLLGAFAKNNKYGPLYQIAGLGFKTRLFTNRYGDNGNPIYKEVRTLLMSEAQEAESRENGYISLGRRYSFNGKNLQDLKSQGIVSTVDIASDPTFSQFGVNDENVGMFLLLLNLGIDLDVIGAFINQPAVLEYTTAVTVEGSRKNDARKAIDNKIKKLIKEKGGKLLDIDLSRLNAGIKNRFNIDELDANLNKPLEQMSVVELVRQREIYAHYFHMAELENGLRALQSVTSWDTSKLDSPISAYENEMAISSLQASEMFNEEGLNNLIKHSFVSNFNVNKVVLETFDKLFPVTNNNLVYSKLLAQLQSLTDKSKKIAAKRIIVNDFVEAIVKTFGEYKGMNFSEYADELQYFDNSPGADNSKIVVDRLSDFKENPSNEEIINQFPIIDKLLSNVNIDTRQVSNLKSKNIEFYRLMDATTEDQNSYIDQLKALINHPDERVANLFKDVCILAFNQSGYNKSFLAFFNIVPFEFFKPIFAIAEGNYNNLSSKEEEGFIDRFSEISVLENPQLFAAEYDNDGITSSNLYYFRGKYYNISPEEESADKEKPANYDELLELAESSKDQTVIIETPGSRFQATFTGELVMVKPAEYNILPDGRRALRSPAFYQLGLVSDTGKSLSLSKTSAKELLKSSEKAEVKKPEVKKPEVKKPEVKKETVTVTDPKELAELNKGRQVKITYEKYNKPFTATVTGTVKQVTDGTFRINSDGSRTRIEDPIYQVEFKTNTGKLVTAFPYEVEGLITTKEVSAPVKPTQPTVFEKTNINTSYTQETQNTIAASKLSEGEYEVVKVNSKEVVISTKDIPATVAPGNQVFYIKSPSGLLIKRYGKRFMVPGYEDIQIMEDQVSKLFYERTTGMNIPINGETDSEAREEMKNKFDKANIRDILSSRVKIEIDLPGAQITSPSVVVPQPTQQIKTEVEVNKDIKDVILKSGLEKGDYEVVLVNGVQTFVDLTRMPETIKKGYSVFYSDYFNGLGLIKRAGKKIVVPGFEDIELILDQEDKSVIELSTGLAIRTKEKTESKIISELEDLFKTKDVRSVLEKARKISANEPDVLISQLNQPSTQGVTSTGISLTQSQIDFAKQNKVEQNFYDKKPYPKETDVSGKVTKWEVYKSKNGKSSMQAALDGDRTESTRSVKEIENLEKLAKNQGIANGITGTIIWMEGQIDNVKNSTNIKGDWFRITSEPYTPNKADFNAYENWDPSVWNNRNSEFKIGQPGEWKSVRFERVAQPSTQTETTNNPAEFTNHSGGAYGADTFWDIIGREFGVTNHKHYREANNSNLSKSLRDNKVEATILSKEEMDKARAEVKKILGEEYPDTLEGNLKVRNFYQVINSDAVFAIGYGIDYKGRKASWEYGMFTRNEPSAIKGVQGGTNVAVQLGIKLKKPVYLFNLNDKKWYEHNGNQFVPTAVPTLTKNFAGVGTRDIESYNVQNKETKKWETRKQYDAGAEEAAKQAIKEVYENTFGKQPAAKVKQSDIKPETLIGAQVEYNPEFPETKAVTIPGSILQARNEQIDYTGDQVKALSEIQSLIDNKQEAFYLLAGYAGTGKTTIAENIIKYGMSKGKDPVVLAPTNKAAEVLTKKLSKTGVSITPSTIHSAIYGEPMPDGTWEIQKEIENSIVIIDESSMIDKQLMIDLISILKNKGNTVVFMGDGFQLEQIGLSSGLFESLTNPEVFENNYGFKLDGSTMMTDVKRQSLDSTILKVATLSRTFNKSIVPTNSTTDFKVETNKQSFVESFRQSIKNKENSVMIVATNNERLAMNTVAREAKYGVEAAKNPILNGDTFISVANSNSHKNSQLFNIDNVDIIAKGTIEIEFSNKRSNEEYYLVKGTHVDNQGRSQPITTIFFPKLDKPSLYHAQVMQGLGTNPQLRSLLRDYIITNKKGVSKLSSSLVIATYGYSITAHKSQGSQWDKVFVNQNYVAPTWNGARWFYTAITRAANSVVVLSSSSLTGMSNSEIESRLNNIALPESTTKTVEEPTLAPGRYVKYNSNTYIVTKITDKMVQLYDPRKEGSASKIQVSVKTLLSKENKILPNVAKIVYFDKTGYNYIVTEKGTIISLQTNTRMDWDETNGNRKAILKLAEESDGINEITESGEVTDEEIPNVESKPLAFRELDEFDDDAKLRILTNFATKYKRTEEQAENYINERLNVPGNKERVLEELRKCNYIF